MTDLRFARSMLQAYYKDNLSSQMDMIDEAESVDELIGHIRIDTLVDHYGNISKAVGSCYRAVLAVQLYGGALPPDMATQYADFMNEANAVLSHMQGVIERYVAKPDFLLVLGADVKAKLMNISVTTFNDKVKLAIQLKKAFRDIPDYLLTYVPVTNQIPTIVPELTDQTDIVGDPVLPLGERITEMGSIDPSMPQSPPSQQPRDIY